MKYMVLLVDGEDWSQMSPEQQASEMAKHEAFDRAVKGREGCEMLGGDALEEDVTTLVQTGENGELVVTDGPYAEATEGIGGYYLIEAPDLDTLVDLLRVLPPYVMEVRPVVDPAAMLG